MDEQQTHTWVKVPAIPTLQADGPLIEIHEATPLNPHGRGAADRPHAGESNILTPKSILTVGCWNVRTLNTTGATEVLMHELKKFRWDIIGIAETHWIGTDDKQYEDNRILSSGREDIHRSGVALVPVSYTHLRAHETDSYL